MDKKEMLISFINWLNTEYDIKEVYEMYADEFLQDVAKNNINPTHKTSNEEKAKMIADQCLPCSSDFYSGIFQGVLLALNCEDRAETKTTIKLNSHA